MAENQPFEEVTPSELPTRLPVSVKQPDPVFLSFRPNQLIAGRYTLLEPLGEGGMGEVWIARQSEPIKRKVAIKLIKIGSDSKGILARFEQERQTLGMLDHPNIARVYDGGMTGDQFGSIESSKLKPPAPPGRPFFVMELVNGQPLTKFCDTHKLSLSDRLELFLPICRAVQHAHQKGIIHRDLKPANIIVSMVDGKPVPKVIDFGVAKLMGGKMISDTLSTQLGSLIGTLDYMSPEQAGLSTEDIDTRADIYALGVVLYELLTGLRPFDSNRLRTAAIDEMLRIIKEEEPPSLASRLSTDESLASMAALRKCEPARLISQVKGELDWIVHKCLEKDRNRRYETANGLARDIERYLSDEPLEARPASSGYRLQKFYRRNRGVVWATGLVACSLLIGTIAALWGLSHALDAEQEAKAQARIAEEAKAKAIVERDQKELARAEEARQRTLAEKNEKLAIKESNRARAVSNFLENDLLALASVESQLNLQAGNLGRDVKVRELLDRAAGQLTGKFKDQPELEAEIRATIGIAYRKLGEYGKAVEHLERAVQLSETTHGPDHLTTQNVRNSLAVAYDHLGQRAKSVALNDAIQESFKRAGISDPNAVLNYQSNRAQSYYSAGRKKEALALMEQTVKECREKLGPQHEQTITASINYAMMMKLEGMAAQALPLMEETTWTCLSIRGDHHPITLVAHINLAQTYLTLGNPQQALSILEKQRPLFDSVLGPDHPNTIICLANLARCYYDLHRHQEAEELYRKVWINEKARLGKDDLTTLRNEFDLALILQELGRTDEAIGLLEHVHQQRSRQLGESHSDTLVALFNWASGMLISGKLDRALSMYQDCYRLYLKTKGRDDPLTIRALGNLAHAYERLGKLDEARKHYEQAREDGLRALGPESSDTFYFGHFLANVYVKLNQRDKAAALFAEVLPYFKKALGDDHGDTLMTAHNLGSVQSDLGNYSQAIEQLQWVLRQRTRVLGAENPETLATQIILIAVNRSAGRHEEAVKLSRALLPVLEKKKGPDDPQVFRIMNYLAASLNRLKRFDEAIIVYQELVKRRSQKLGPHHLDTLMAQANLGNNFYSAGQFAKGIALLEECYQHGKGTQGIDFYRQSLLTCYGETGEHAKAEPLHREEVAAAKKKYGDNDFRTATALESQATCFDALKRWGDASAAWRECLVNRKKGDIPWNIAATQVRLGLSLLENKKVDEAEPLLVEACQTLQPLLGDAAHREVIRKALHDGSLGLSKHYTAAGKTAEADRWRKQAAATEK
ncbi:MAG: serine/threonine-protein kinase [Gemmatales bacterium]